MTPFNATEHLDDAMLVRHLDDRAGDANSDARAHLVTCGRCLARLELVRQRSDALGAALKRAPVVPLDARAREEQCAAIETRLATRKRASRRAPLWHSPWLRAAAGIVIVAGIAAAAPPVRAWIAARVDALTSAPRPERGTSAAPRESAREAPTSEVYFATTGRELEITFTARQAAGEILVTRAGEARSSVSVIGGSEELVVLPNGVRVRNEATSTSSYLIRAASGVEHVRVRTAAVDTVITVPDRGVVRVRR